VAIGAVLDGGGEDLAIGDIMPAGAIDEGAAGDAEGEIGAGRGDMHLLFTLEPVDDLILAGFDLVPIGDRVIGIRQDGVVDEILIIAQGHAGVLGIGIGREEREHPVHIAFGFTFEHDIGDPGGRGGVHAGDGRVELGGEFGVVLAIDKDAVVVCFDHVHQWLEERIEILGFGVAVDVLEVFAVIGRQHGKGAGLDDLFADLGHERLAAEGALDHDALAGLDAQTVIDHQVGYFFGSWIMHDCS
jgi:hypothetical protein